MLKTNEQTSFVIIMGSLYDQIQFIMQNYGQSVYSSDLYVN